MQPSVKSGQRTCACLSVGDENAELRKKKGEEKEQGAEHTSSSDAMTATVLYARVRKGKYSNRQHFSLLLSPDYDRNEDVEAICNLLLIITDHSLSYILLTEEK